jgi:hypothetical protein
MNLKTQVLEFIAAGEIDGLDGLVVAEPGAIRFLVGCSYRVDAREREIACRAIGRAGHHHPLKVQQVVRRLVWAMNDESGTNALTAPEVVKAVADETPELLLPLVPDLTRLAGDEGLYTPLAESLEILAAKFPGSVGRGIQDSLNRMIDKVGKRRKAHGIGNE